MEGTEPEARRRRKIHVLTGPTAVGKTALSLDWAEATGAEIVSCDPLLFYRGMDVGTAKPTAEDRSRVIHHLIDIAAVDQPVDIRMFLDRAQEVIEGIWERSGTVLVCGASGFYLQAFFRPVVDSVTVPDAIRDGVRDRLKLEGLDSLVEALGRLNPNGLGELDIRNPRRVTRALERCLATGRDLNHLRMKMSRTTNCLIEAEKITVRLSRERGELDRRIEHRVREMLQAGLIEEVEHLLASGLGANPSAVRAVGYREVIEWLPERGSLDDLVAAISGNTRKLVRKQLNWFRNQLPPHRVVQLSESGETVSAAALFAS